MEGREDRSLDRNLPAVLSTWQRHTDLCCCLEAKAAVRRQVWLAPPCTPAEGERHTCIPAPPWRTCRPKTGPAGEPFRWVWAPRGTREARLASALVKRGPPPRGQVWQACRSSRGGHSLTTSPQASRQHW